MFRTSLRRAKVAESVVPVDDAPRHAITSEFSTALCRFVLECTCGSAFETNYIDAALEWWELHLALAPLEDQLAPSSR